MDKFGWCIFLALAILGSTTVFAYIYGGDFVTYGYPLAVLGSLLVLAGGGAVLAWLKKMEGADAAIFIQSLAIACLVVGLFMAGRPLLDGKKIDFTVALRHIFVGFLAAGFAPFISAIVSVIGRSDGIASSTTLDPAAAAVAAATLAATSVATSVRPSIEAMRDAVERLTSELEAAADKARALGSATETPVKQLERLDPLFTQIGNLLANIEQFFPKGPTATPGSPVGRS